MFLNRFSKKQADSSTGAMKSVSLQALKGLSASEVKALRMGKNLIAPPGLSVLQTIAWQRRAAKRRRAWVKVRVVLAFVGARGFRFSEPETTSLGKPQHDADVVKPIVHEGPDGMTTMERLAWKREQKAKKAMSKLRLVNKLGGAAALRNAVQAGEAASKANAAGSTPAGQQSSTDGQEATALIHVRGIGMDGWDGTPEGRGTYENEDALEKIFSVFGVFLQATIRHRIVDGENTSWALVEMETAEAVDAALAAKEVKAGS